MSWRSGVTPFWSPAEIAAAIVHDARGENILGALAFADQLHEALGYLRSSQGVHAMGTDNGIPVTFMRKSDAIAPGKTALDAGTDLGGNGSTHLL